MSNIRNITYSFLNKIDSEQNILPVIEKLLQLSKIIVELFKKESHGEKRWASALEGTCNDALKQLKAGNMDGFDYTMERLDAVFVTRETIPGPKEAKKAYEEFKSVYGSLLSSLREHNMSPIKEGSVSDFDLVVSLLRSIKTTSSTDSNKINVALGHLSRIKRKMKQLQQEEHLDEMGE